jgi:hypothetical protein
LLKGEDKESDECILRRFALLAIAMIIRFISGVESLYYVIERPSRRFSRADLNARNRLESNYLILRKMKPTSDEVVCEESAQNMIVSSMLLRFGLHPPKLQ